MTGTIAAEPTDAQCAERLVASMSHAVDRVGHEPVLTDAVLRYLAPCPGETMVDATVGAGGHGRHLAPRLLEGGRLLGLDRDPAALAAAAQQLAEFSPMVSLVRADFRDLQGVLRRQGLEAVDGLLADLGVSSLQLDHPARGFSFLTDAPLDMRMDPDGSVTAADLVNTQSADALADLFTTLGEERFSRQIARGIVEARRRGRLSTTKQLVDVIVRAVPPAARHGRLHVATRTFQALRLAVNDELGALRSLLEHLPAVLRPGGRAVIISFHSGEDRLVKRAFAEGARRGVWTVLTKTPVRPGHEEMARNPRARSAKLRAVRREPR